MKLLCSYLKYSVMQNSTTVTYLSSLDCPIFSAAKVVASPATSLKQYARVPLSFLKIRMSGSEIRTPVGIHLSPVGSQPDTPDMQGFGECKVRP